MKSTLTSKGQITIPVAIQRRLGLEVGDVLEFDDSAPYVKAHKPFSIKQMCSAIGRTKAPHCRGSEEWVEEFRGPVELP